MEIVSLDSQERDRENKYKEYEAFGIRKLLDYCAFGEID